MIRLTLNEAAAEPAAGSQEATTASSPAVESVAGLQEASSSSSPAGEPVTGLPEPSISSSRIADMGDSYRSAEVPGEPMEEVRSLDPRLLRLAGLGAALVAAVILIVFGARSFHSTDQTVLTNDLGTQSKVSAGIGGRLIAQWKSGASYRLTIDPLDAGNLPAFQAVTRNLPHAMVFLVRMKNDTGGIACQKQIVVTPSSMSEVDADEQNPAAPTTPTGDTVQNVANSNGQIGELAISGPLPCNLMAFQSIVAWEFTTDFPSLTEQSAWLGQRENARAMKNSPGPRFIKNLPAPMESDDVIVSDIPSKGVVSTSGGHTFLVATDVLNNRAFGWHLFPASIHYRCDRNAVCALTRLGMSSTVRARLLR